MKKIKDLNYYELLEVAYEASAFEVHQAYKEMIQLYHDDSLASYSFFSREEREEILRRLEEAYSTLMDEKRRSQYDQLLLEQGILQKATPSQRDRTKLSLMSDAKRLAANEALRIRDRFKPIASSNPVIQEILANDVLSGKDLKRIRDELGISLEEISEMVKVRMVYLHAIENDQFEKTPSRIFLKGFLRAYAQCMGLDADVVASRYLKRIHD